MVCLTHPCSHGCHKFEGFRWTFIWRGGMVLMIGLQGETQSDWFPMRLHLQDFRIRGGMRYMTWQRDMSFRFALLPLVGRQWQPGERAAARGRVAVARRGALVRPSGRLSVLSTASRGGLDYVQRCWCVAHWFGFIICRCCKMSCTDFRTFRIGKDPLR